MTWAPTLGGGASAWLFWATVIGGVTALVVWAAREAWLFRTLEADSRSDPAAPEGTDPETGLLRADQWAAAGDHASAVRHTLGRVLFHLSESGAISLNAATTSREALRQVRDQSDVARPLSVLVAAVEQSVFGDLVLFENDYSRCREAAASILRRSS